MDFGREAFLTGEREAALFAVAREGCAEAHRRLVTSALPWVVRIAKEYRDYGVPFEDLVQEGVLGLLEAVRRYDPARGSRLLTYAAPWIRKTIRQALDRQAAVVRASTYASRRRVGAGERRILTRRFGLDGRPSESLDAVGSHLGISRERVRQIEGSALDKLRRGIARSRRDDRSPRRRAQKKGTPDPASPDVCWTIQPM